MLWVLIWTVSASQYMFLLKSKSEKLQSWNLGSSLCLHHGPELMWEAMGKALLTYLSKPGPQLLVKIMFTGQTCELTRTLGVRNENLIFLFLNQNICCGYSKEPSQWDGPFEHPKHVLKLMGEKIFTLLPWKFLFI